MDSHPGKSPTARFRDCVTGRLTPLEKPIVQACLCFALFCGANAATARIVEQVVELPVQVADAQGKSVNHRIKVTIFRDDSRARSPFLILNHGRSGKVAVRAALSVKPYAGNARYFVDRGFAVFAPVRVGYGITGGPDVEDSGECRTKNYPPVYEAAARQSIEVIAYAKSLRYVDPSRGLVAGQSFGGTTAIALAARNVPGIIGAVNFAGGGGGRPETRPGQPCRDDLLAELFASYGTTARIPTLWLYSVNDMYWGKDKPHAWFKGFIDRGGAGRFVQLPPYKADGHPSFTGNPAAWKPSVEEFLRPLF